MTWAKRANVPALRMNSVSFVFLKKCHLTISIINESINQSMQNDRCEKSNLSSSSPTNLQPLIGTSLSPNSNAIPIAASTSAVPNLNSNNATISSTTGLPSSTSATSVSSASARNNQFSFGFFYFEKILFF